MSANVAICHPGGSGLIMPLVSDESEWPDTLRGLLYGFAMVYCFLGVSIIADIFMDSITVITSRRRQVYSANGMRTQKVWNNTVATLSLMALGSSAPEICLSMIELLKREMHVGNLGPSVIVGSAAFNLLVIVAVCIMAIPSTEVRRIQSLPVFYVTALFSLLAYLWLALILTVFSVDVVTIWESAVTLALLPVLVYVSWKTDTGATMRVLSRVFRQPSWDPDPQPARRSEAQETISFVSRSLFVTRKAEEQTVEVQVMRSGDCKGNASCTYRTERFTAVPEYDYVGSEGSLEFEPGVAQQTVTLTVLANKRGKAKRELFIVLEEAEGAGFDPDDDGGGESAILTVTLALTTDGDGPGKAGAASVLSAAVSLDALSLGMRDWGRQSISSLYCNGSAEEQRTATVSEWALHLVCLPWNVLFLVVPPLSLFGGWLCFYGSLVMIAGLTAALSDLAELFGCVCSVPDIITAMTFVALGTSMPDLFASLSAARVDPTADASIVNVTGSNAVNVYLGLGLPWTVGAIYWAIKGRTAEWESRYDWVKDTMDGAAFVVDSRNLGFSVLVFTCASIEALLLLHFRRKFLGAELGGPLVPKVVVSVTFIATWAGFCAMVGWRVLRSDEASVLEDGLVLGLTGSVELALGLVAIAVTVMYRQEQPPTEEPMDFGHSLSHQRPELSMRRSMSKNGSLTSNPDRVPQEAPIRSRAKGKKSALSVGSSSISSGGLESGCTSDGPSSEGPSFWTQTRSLDTPVPEVPVGEDTAQEPASQQVKGTRRITGASLGVGARVIKV
mmetsp:Transcript_82507/g.260481  ORF Transcript_82507/g.260481 Transcript_82507/m.260481 type:complete len:787 (-) Transcript_82507:45-2405(-)